MSFSHVYIYYYKVIVIVIYISKCHYIHLSSACINYHIDKVEIVGICGYHIVICG